MSYDFHKVTNGQVAGQDLYTELCDHVTLPPLSNLVEYNGPVISPITIPK